VTYEFRGEQYIAVPMGNAVWAFKLNGHLLPQSPPSAPPHNFGFTGVVESLPSDRGVIAIGTLESFAAGTVQERYADEFGFRPSRVAIKAGATVRFTNFGILRHTIVAADGSWTTGEIEPAQSVSVTIGKPGIQVFFDPRYPFAKGQLIVR
jgi:plastocyanin